ncbi:MAG: hypothetical protein JJU13_12845 [Balneolaceae bacterium]|nr:hypothetical protein [Balneolaceae bacterium]
MQYCFTPLKSHRSSIPFMVFEKNNFTAEKQLLNKKETTATPESIFDFLGINPAIEKISKEPAGSEVYDVLIDLEKFKIGKKKFKSFHLLIEDLKAQLATFIHPEMPTLFRFRAKPKTYFMYYKKIPDLSKSEIDYRNFFIRNARKKVGNSHFISSKIKLMVHIRQGDTAVVQTPWKTFIPVWHKIPGKFTQFKRMEDIPNSQFTTIDNFYNFLEKLQQNLGKELFSTVVFSDGFKKAFLQIYLKSKRSDLSDQEIEKLKEIQANYDKNQFSNFEKLSNTKTIVGEELDNLYDLVQTFMEAEILVIGTQQIMIPKLVASYCNRENMPLIIVLYSSKKLNLDFIGLENDSPNILQIDIHDYDIREISTKIKAFITKIATRPALKNDPTKIIYK